MEEWAAKNALKLIAFFVAVGGLLYRQKAMEKDVARIINDMKAYSIRCSGTSSCKEQADRCSALYVSRTEFSSVLEKLEEQQKLMHSMNKSREDARSRMTDHLIEIKSFMSEMRARLDG